MHTLLPTLIIGAINFGLPLFEIELGRSAHAQNQPFTYLSSTDPFEADATIRSRANLARSRSRSDRALLGQLFNSFRAGNRPGQIPIIANSVTRPPRSAPEVVIRGGDCSELLGPPIAAIQYLNSTHRASIQGGIRIVHFRSAPALLFHAYIYAQIGGREIIFDPSARNLGELSIPERYDLVRELTFSEASYIYHKEWGDYFSGARDFSHAVLAYNQALIFYDFDPNVHRNLAAACSTVRDQACTQEHLTRAAQIERHR